MYCHDDRASNNVAEPEHHAYLLVLKSSVHTRMSGYVLNLDGLAINAALPDVSLIPH